MPVRSSSLRITLALVCLVGACLGLTGAAASRAAAGLSIDTLVDIRHPSLPVWSPDGRHVAFVWDRAGVQNLYVVEASGTAAPVARTTFAGGDLGQPFWSTDGQALYVSADGDLWRVAASGSTTATRAWTTPDSENGIVPSPDRTAVAFVRDNDLWTRQLASGAEQRLTTTPETESGIVWSPDGAHLAYITGRSTRRDRAPEYSGAKILYTWIERESGDVQVIAASGGTARTLAPSPMSESTLRWLDRDRVVFQRVSQDTTTREIVAASVTTGTSTVLVRETDPKWWSIPPRAEAGPAPSPDGRWVAFLSDRVGWDHVYVVPAAGGAPVQLTRGAFEAWRPVWSPDSSRIAFDANLEGQPGRRHVGLVVVGGGSSSAMTLVTDGRGTNTAAAWSPDGRRVLYQHTDPQSPADLFVSDASPRARMQRLTDSLPSSVDRSALVEPELVHYPGPDGRPVPAFLFVPKGLDRSVRHPAIVWIHGDGQNQNYDGWHIERNYAVYYSVHQYLLQQGYVVLAPDYRGSIGYGREWRQGVFLDVGGKDYEDAALGGTYLKAMPYVDPARIGVWGLSYGGFFTLQALTAAPKAFAAGIDVAGVVDYRMYFEDPYRGSWTYARMRAPEDNPKAYDVASPLSRMDRLERPLLILHGTSDVNVPYLHSVRLVDHLMKLGKQDFDFVTYPGEFHYFTRAHVLRDAWTRVDRFFAQYLKPGR